MAVRKTFRRGGVIPLPKADFKVEATTGGVIPLPYNPTNIIPNRGVVGAAPYKCHPERSETESRDLPNTSHRRPLRSLRALMLGRDDAF